MKSKLTSFLFALLLITPFLAQAQINDRQETLTIYLDCRGCDGSFIRTEISFVNFVRDQADAEVHLLITRQTTGSGGREYTLNYMGLGVFSEHNNQIKFTTPESDTNEQMRNKLVKYVKLGLVSFLSDRNVLSDLELTYHGSGEDRQASQPEDPWNSWVFEIGVSTNFSGEQSQNRFYLGGRVNARRITEEWKLNFNYRQNYNRRSYTSEDDEGKKVTDVYIIEDNNFFGLVAKTINDHWTVGSYTRTRSSSQDNIDLSIGATPSIEYSVFPYSEFTRREITFRYGVLGSWYDYTETTIFQQDSEFLLRQELSARMDFTQPWGGVFGWLDMGNYMHDFSKNRVNFGLRLNMRVFRGLSVYLSGNYSLINDQLSLPAGDTSEEELLLNLKQQATSYDFGGSIGLEFNFGSKFSNVVNSRF